MQRGSANMKVTILAGELGTRLSEETTARPKPMVKLLDYQDAYSFFKAAHLERGYSNFARMPHALIQAIRNRVDQINGDGGEQLHGLKPGETVVIQDGPFAGQEAIFDSRISGNERVRVLLSLLRGRQMPLVLPSAQIERKK